MDRGSACSISLISSASSGACSVSLIKYKFYRSEYHSQTSKVLKANGLVNVNEKDIRLDFIFTNSTGIQDVFFCENEPTIKISNKDKHKADYLRESALRHWSSLLLYEECT